MESAIADLEEDLQQHKLEAARSLENYHEKTKRCESQWKEIVALESNQNKMINYIT